LLLRVPQEELMILVAPPAFDMQCVIIAVQPPLLIGAAYESQSSSE